MFVVVESQLPSSFGVGDCPKVYWFGVGMKERNSKTKSCVCDAIFRWTGGWGMMVVVLFVWAMVVEVDGHAVGEQFLLSRVIW